MTARLLTSAAIASLGAPGLPNTKRGVHTRRLRDNWPTVEREGRLLVDVDRLPDDVRAAIEARLAPSAPIAPVDDTRRSPGRPRGTDYFTRHPEVAEAIVAILARQRLAAPRVHELLATRFADLPPLRTLQRHVERLERERAAVFASIRDPDLYKGKYRLALGRADASVTRAHQVWELDTTKADVLTKGGRIMILGLIDRWSRRVRFMIAPSESGQSVRRLLVTTIEAWGVMPESVATDNGSGYINASVKSALAMLGIEHRICPPGSPEKKPYVERVFGTFTRARAELLAGYAGHNVADAQRLRGRAKKETGRALVVPELEPEQLQAILDAWVDGVYHVGVHSGIGTSPLLRWQSCRHPARAAPSRDKLVIALSALVGSQVVGKRGIQWKRGRYWSPALAAYIGRSVEVRRDEDDLGALFVFDEDGRYIDTAVNAARAGLSEEAFARVARGHQSAAMNAARALIREQGARFRVEDARDQLLRQDAENAGKLVALPLPTRPHDNDVLASMDGAVAPSPATLVRPAEAVILPMPQARITPDDDALAARVARADRLIADAGSGHEVDAAHLAWAHSFVAGPAYRTFVAGRAPDAMSFMNPRRLADPNRPF